MDKKSIIKFENITFVRNDQVILKNIDFEIFDQQNWVVLGPNGSGKSLLFSMLFAYNLPTKGHIKVWGKEFGKSNWQHVKKRMRIVSSVLERFDSVLERMTAYEIVASGLKNSFGLYERIYPEEDKKVTRILKKHNFLHKKDALYKNFSAGEKKKVLILRALITEPEILILDEPCSNLDIYQKEQVLETLQKIKDINLVYITHDINEIIEKFDYVLLLKEGQVFDQGSRENILTEQKLSDLYGLNLEVDLSKGRPFWQIIN